MGREVDLVEVKRIVSLFYFVIKTNEYINTISSIGRINIPETVHQNLEYPFSLRYLIFGKCLYNSWYFKTRYV